MERFISEISCRSYNEQLFPQAVEVLNRIGHPPERIAAFVKLGEHIKVKFLFLIDFQKKRIVLSRKLRLNRRKKMLHMMTHLMTILIRLQVY